MSERTKYARTILNSLLHSFIFHIYNFPVYCWDIFLYPIFTHKILYAFSIMYCLLFLSIIHSLQTAYNCTLNILYGFIKYYFYFVYMGIRYICLTKSEVYECTVYAVLYGCTFKREDWIMSSVRKSIRKTGWCIKVRHTHTHTKWKMKNINLESLAISHSCWDRRAIYCGKLFVRRRKNRVTKKNREKDMRIELVKVRRKCFRCVHFVMHI